MPFLVRIPERFHPPVPAGSVVTTPAMLADLFPTCLDLAGIWTEADAAERDGQSLLRAEHLATRAGDGGGRGDGNERGDAAGSGAGDAGGDGAGRWLYGQCGSGRNAFYMATDGRWKYLYYTWGGTEQLIDLRADPGECVNMLRNPAASAAVAECRQRLGARFPDLLAQGRAADHPFRQVDEPLPDEARTRATNPYAWRGPIRYGGHW